jgi:glucose/arabinose dehydrogenase
MPSSRTFHLLSLVLLLGAVAAGAVTPGPTVPELPPPGLRNPVGLAFEPVTGARWTTVNERDGLGPEVPPDFLTRVVDGAFYGWPWVCFGTYVDPIQQNPNPAAGKDAQQRARVLDLALGAHSVPAGPAELPDGLLLVADDAGNTLWRVAPGE